MMPATSQIGAIDVLQEGGIMPDFEQPRASIFDALLAQVRLGQPAALEALVLEHVPALERIVAAKLDAMTRRVLDDEDALQEIKIKVMRGIGDLDFRGPGAFRCWLMRVAENALKDMRRRHCCPKRGLGRVRSLQDGIGVSPSGHEQCLVDQVRAAGRGPLSEVLRDERCEQVRRALQRLPVPERDIIEHMYMRSEPAAEFARRQGKSEPAVRKQLQRALRMLERFLPSNGDQSKRKGDRQ
jgi:RNA polymerase sigma factor (sigma-70 family)